MAVTQAGLRLRIKRLVYSARPALRPYRDQVVNPLSSAGLVLDVTDGTSWAVQDIVEFSDGEQALVVSIAANALTLQRGQFGTTPGAQAAGVEIEKNPRFSIPEIDIAIDTVLSDLYPQIYKLDVDASNNAVAGQEWYPLADDSIIDVISVYYQERTYNIPNPIMGWEYRKVISPGFTEDQGIRLSSFGGASIGDPIYIVSRKKITAAADLLDRQEAMVSMGAVYHLLGPEQVSRTHDPGQRTDRTVAAGQDGRDSIWFLREYRTMLTREEIRLKADEMGLPRDRIEARRHRWIS